MRILQMMGGGDVGGAKTQYYDADSGAAGAK